jgi:predicted Zn-dependent protease with MMP-like domain
MISMDEMEAMLDEIAEELPNDFYKDLNGGIILLPEIKLHANSKENDLYILGEYHHNGNLGRFITIYYGSFSHVYGHLSKDQLKEQLKSTLKHEFRHHLESMGGERDLEIKDEQNIAEYMNSKDRLLNKKPYPKL